MGQNRRTAASDGYWTGGAGWCGRIRLLVVALLVGGLGATGSMAQVIQPQQVIQRSIQGARNILLIIGDDMGVDKIEPYVTYHNSNVRTDDDITGASTVPCTPTIRALSECGVMFLNAWACPTCSPTRASIVTGTHPFRHGVYSPGTSNVFTTGPAGGHAPTTIAQVLSDAGYTSGLFGKWHLGSAPNQGPVDHGWSKHQGFLLGEVEHYYDWTKVTSEPGVADVFDPADGVLDEADYVPSVNVIDAATWINSQTTRWLAIVAFNAAHTAGGTLVDQAPPSDCGCDTVRNSNDQNEVYRATVSCMDERIADLLAAIDPSQLQRTTIIFMGDNGTESARSFHFAANGKGTLNEGGVHVPLIIADGYSYLNNGAQTPLVGDGRVVSPRRTSIALVQAVDLYATIADIAGADKSCGVDALSLIPILNNTATTVHDVCFAQISSTAWTVRTSRYKLIEVASDCGPPRQLYDLSNDRWEQVNLLCDGTSWTEGHIISDLQALKAAILAVPDCYP